MNSDNGFVKQVSEVVGLPVEELARRLKGYSDDCFTLLKQIHREYPRHKAALGKIWEETEGVVYVDLETTQIVPHVAELIPHDVAKESNVIALYEFGEVLTVATSRAKDEALMGRLQALTDRFVSPVFAFPEEVDDAIEVVYASQAALTNMIKETGIDALTAATEQVSRETLRKLNGEEYIVSFLDGVILTAIHERASDVHIEPNEHRIRIRYRIDGSLQERYVLEPALLGPLVNRVKIIAEADISEQRRPQDGRIRYDLPNRA